jgi:putative ABC transport system substrate-binding protein
MMQGGQPTVGGSLVEEFKERLRELGYVEGSDYALEVRWAEGRLDRMPEIAAELAARTALKVGTILPAVGGA